MRGTYVRWAGLAVCVLVAGVPVVRGDDKDLEQKLKELNNLSGDRVAIRKAIALSKDKAAATPLLKYADDQAKLDSKKLKYNAAYALALTAGELKEYDMASRFYKICEKQGWDVKAPTKILQGFEGQFRILAAQKKFEEAEELCVKTIERVDKEDNQEIRRLVLQLEEDLIKVLTRQGKVEEALKIVNAAIKDNEVASWYFMYLKGDVLHEAGRDEESAKTYLAAIESLEKNENIKPEAQESIAGEIRYKLSNVYVELNQVEKAADQLKTLLKRKPENPGYNNDLGYIWADHNMNLDESEKLIRKALELDKKNREELKKKGELDPEQDHDSAAYLDSLGWVLYKKKQFAEAKKPLLEATKIKQGEHVEILDHLADVHMALGEKAEAIKVWKKALGMDAETRRDLKRHGEIMKKLKAVEAGAAPPKPAEKKAEPKPPEKKP